MNSLKSLLKFLSLWLVLNGIILPRSIQAKIYTQNGLIFDINCYNKHFDIIPPNLLRFSLQKKGEQMFLHSDVKGFKPETFRVELIQGQNQYQVDLNLKDPIFTVHITGPWGDPISDCYVNVDQGLGYGGDRFGFVCFFPKKGYPYLTPGFIQLYRDELGKKFKDVKVETRLEGEFMRLEIRVRRLDLWQDKNTVFVLVYPPNLSGDMSRSVYLSEEIENLKAEVLKRSHDFLHGGFDHRQTREEWKKLLELKNRLKLHQP